MDTDKVIQDLNRRFAAPLPEFYQRRIIFWYDEDKEFEDKLDEVVLERIFCEEAAFCRRFDHKLSGLQSAGVQPPG